MCVKAFSSQLLSQEPQFPYSTGQLQSYSFAVWPHTFLQNWGALLSNCSGCFWYNYSKSFSPYCSPLLLPQTIISLIGPVQCLIGHLFLIIYYYSQLNSFRHIKTTCLEMWQRHDPNFSQIVFEIMKQKIVSMEVSVVALFNEDTF